MGGSLPQKLNCGGPIGRMVEVDFRECFAKNPAKKKASSSESSTKADAAYC